MIDARLRHLQFLHRVDGALPGFFFLLSGRQVQFPCQLGEALQRDGVEVVVVALDDLLLIGGIFALGLVVAHEMRITKCVPSCNAYRAPASSSTGRPSARSTPALSSCWASRTLIRRRTRSGSPRRSRACAS